LPDREEFNMTEHITRYSHPSMMKPYGLLLENFQENASSVNDCVFTMMHHISGDLSCPQVIP
jgi:hypothetical protein